MDGQDLQQSKDFPTLMDVGDMRTIFEGVLKKYREGDGKNGAYDQTAGFPDFNTETEVLIAFSYVAMYLVKIREKTNKY